MHVNILRLKIFEAHDFFFIGLDVKICKGCLDNLFKQECIPVGCLLPTH